MPALNNKVRAELLSLIGEELKLVNDKAESLASDFWAKAEQQVAQELGYGETLTRIEFVKNQIEGLQTELNILEGNLKERSRSATPEHYGDIGLKIGADRYGHIYNRPYVFGKQIVTYWDTLVLAKLNETMPFFAFYQTVTQLHHVVKRELLLCGSFEDARALYNRFHAKITESIGDTLPGLLQEVRAIPALERPFNQNDEEQERF